MRIGSMFSGYGGLDAAAAAVFGGTVAWHVENDPRPAAVLAARYPTVPNLGDIAKVNWVDVEPVEILTAGFPCQDISNAGRRAGIRTGNRSGLWSQVAIAVDRLRPQFVIIENVGALLSAKTDSDLEYCPWCMGGIEPQRVVRAHGLVLGDLADIGYDAAWCRVSAAEVGAPHRRQRIFILAWPATDPPHLGYERGWQSRRRRPGLADGRVDAADPGGAGLAIGPVESDRHECAAVKRNSRNDAAADAEGVGWGEGRPESTRFGGRQNARQQRHRALAHADGDAVREQPVRLDGREGAAVPGRDGAAVPGRAGWGRYAAAVDRWAAVLGRPAPAPTQPGRNGNPQLSARFTEWMMGLPGGWVTDILGRNPALHVLGNGVVPLQAELALRRLLRARGASSPLDPGSLSYIHLRCPPQSYGPYTQTTLGAEHEPQNRP